MARRRQVDELTDAEIRTIRRKYARGETSQKRLGAEHGVTSADVGRITRGAVRREAGGSITRNGRTKLSHRQIAALRRRYAQGVASQAQLAREYGVSAAAISRLVRGHTYDAVGGPLTDKGGMPHGRKLTPKQILEVARSSESMSALARRFGVTRQAIQALRKRWVKRSPGPDEL